MSLSEDSSSSHSSSLYGSFFANQPKQSHIFKQDVVDEINELNKQIEKISAQNLASRIEIEKLTSDVSAITKAISSTTECLQMDVSKLEAENQQLREDIEKRKSLISVINSLTQRNPELRNNNPELTNLNSILQNYSDVKKSSLQLGDQTVNEEIQKIDYFKCCTTNEEFLDKCKELLREVSDLTKRKNSFSSSNKNETIQELRIKLENMRYSHTIRQAKLAQKINDLLEEKHKLEQLILTNQRNTNFRRNNR